ncbi:hypothetical protein AAD001_05470 [Colwelliaceae bacterium 6471]
MNLTKTTLAVFCVLATNYAVANNDAATELANMIAVTNNQLITQGANFQIMKVEAIVNSDSEYAGITVLAKNVGNKRLGAQFVPNDPRRLWSTAGDGPGDSITHTIDTVDGTPTGGLATAAEAEEAIRMSMATWDNVNCSNMPIVEVGNSGDLGVVAALNGLGGSLNVDADVMQAGWGDINFSGGILAATYTFVFTDPSGFTDVDSDGYLDTAFREIYYDPSYAWSVDGTAIDIETVALHENGHALSQAHFGTVIIHKNALRANPRAVMNAIYGGEFRSLTGTDKGGHCGMWAQWPNN